MIEIQNLTKEYGRIKAVDNISFNVNKGEILGFRSNGAGKSTTMNILTGSYPHPVLLRLLEWIFWKSQLR